MKRKHQIILFFVALFVCWIIGIPFVVSLPVVILVWIALIYVPNMVRAWRSMQERRVEKLLADPEKAELPATKLAQAHVARRQSAERLAITRGQLEEAKTAEAVTRAHLNLAETFGVKLGECGRIELWTNAVLKWGEEGDATGPVASLAIGPAITVRIDEGGTISTNFVPSKERSTLTRTVAGGVTAGRVGAAVGAGNKKTVREASTHQVDMRTLTLTIAGPGTVIQETFPYYEGPKLQALAAQIDASKARQDPQTFKSDINAAIAQARSRLDAAAATSEKLQILYKQHELEAATSEQSYNKARNLRPRKS